MGRTDSVENEHLHDLPMQRAPLVVDEHGMRNHELPSLGHSPQQRRGSPHLQRGADYLQQHKQLEPYVPMAYNMHSKPMELSVNNRHMPSAASPRPYLVDSSRSPNYMHEYQLATSLPQDMDAEHLAGPHRRPLLHEYDHEVHTRACRLAVVPGFRFSPC
jgi:hypothetical protein